MIVNGHMLKTVRAVNISDMQSRHIYAKQAYEKAKDFKSRADNLRKGK